MNDKHKVDPAKWSALEAALLCELVAGLDQAHRALAELERENKPVQISVKTIDRTRLYEVVSFLSTTVRRDPYIDAQIHYAPEPEAI